MKKKCILIIICTLFGSHFSLIAQSIISIDKSIQKQKIDGFGATGMIYSKNSDSSYTNEAFIKEYIDDIGFTISKLAPPNIEPSNDDDDPNHFDHTKITLSSSDKAKFDFIKSANERALKNGDSFKVFYSIESPPAWCKYNNREYATDHIWNRLIANDFTPPNWNTFDIQNKPDMTPDDKKDEFAEHCEAIVKLHHLQTNSKPYAISLQSEPIYSYFEGNLKSCSYSPEQYREMLRTVAPRIKKESSSTLLVMHDLIMEFGHIGGYTFAITRDSATARYFDCLAIRDYIGAGVDGIAKIPSEKNWNNIKAIANSRFIKKTWQSHSSGYNPAWENNTKCCNSFWLAQSIFNSFNGADVSVWLWGDMAIDISKEEVPNIKYHYLIVNNEKNKNYYTIKHFSKFIRPGSTLIKASCEDTDLKILASQDDLNQKLTVVILNLSTFEKRIKLNIINNESKIPTEFKMFQTNATDNCAQKENHLIGNEIILPPYTLITLSGEGSSPLTINSNLAENRIDASIFPNPAKEFVSIKIPNHYSKEELSLALYSSSGILKTEQLIPLKSNANTLDFDTKLLEDGLYFIEIKPNNGKSTYLKLLIQH